MPHLYSIPINLCSIDEKSVDADWVIPPDAEQMLQEHCHRPGFSLETLFRYRLAKEAFSMGWGWMLVVLPGRYPIGGQLAYARGGSKENMILLDREQVAKWMNDKKVPGHTDKYPLSPPIQPVDVHVSLFWIPSKGLMKKAGERAGDWFSSLARTVEQVPEKGHWIYFADAPPEQWVSEVSKVNLELYTEWCELHRGPQWQTLNDPSDRVICQMQLSLASSSCLEKAPYHNRRYLKHRPNDARGWNVLAMLYFQMTRYARAAAIARRSARLAPRWLYPRHLQMRSLFKLSRYSDAGIIAEDILRDAPMDVPSLTIASHGATATGRGQEAIGFMERATEIDPRNRENKIYLASWYYRAGKYEQAENLFESLLLDNPSDGVLLNNYGYLLARRGELEKAKVLCERSCSQGKTSNNLDSLGYTYMRLGFLDRAVDLFRQALALDPDHQEAVKHLEEVEALLGRVD